MFAARAMDGDDEQDELTRNSLPRASGSVATIKSKFSCHLTTTTTTPLQTRSELPARLLQSGLRC